MPKTGGHQKTKRNKEKQRKTNRAGGRDEKHGGCPRVGSSFDCLVSLEGSQRVEPNSKKRGRGTVSGSKTEKRERVTRKCNTYYCPNDGQGGGIEERAQGRGNNAK